MVENLRVLIKLDVDVFWEINMLNFDFKLNYFLTMFMTQVNSWITELMEGAEISNFAKIHDLILKETFPEEFRINFYFSNVFMRNKWFQYRE